MTPLRPGTPSLPPGASVRPNPTPGDPVTAADHEPDATDDLEAVAEELIRKAGALALLLTEEPTDTATKALVAQALALAGSGIAQLAALDFARELAESRSPAVEIVLDGDGDLWVLVGEDQFECQSSHDERQTLEQIRDRFGVSRMFVAAPPGDR